MPLGHSPYAPASLNKPLPPGYCDRCNFKWPLHKLNWEMIWAGSALVRTGFRICPHCFDQPNPNGKKPIRIDGDPRPIPDIRPGFQAQQSGASSPLLDSAGNMVRDNSGSIQFSSPQFVGDD